MFHNFILYIHFNWLISFNLFLIGKALICYKGKIFNYKYCVIFFKKEWHELFIDFVQTIKLWIKHIKDIVQGRKSVPIYDLFTIFCSLSTKSRRLHGLLILDLFPRFVVEYDINPKGCMFSIPELWWIDSKHITMGVCYHKFEWVLLLFFFLLPTLLPTV